MNGRLLGTATIAALAAASCTGSSSPDAFVATSLLETTVETNADFSEVTTTVAEPTRAVFDDGPLADVCPSRIVIQLAGIPSVENGPLFRLLGPEPIVDDAAQSVSAALIRFDGSAEEVDLEIRAGGPAIDFRSAIDVMLADPGVVLAEASTAQVMAAAVDLSTIGVVTLSDRSHQGVVWDPTTYPSIEGIDDLGSEGVEVRHLDGEPFVSFLTANNVLDEGQLVSDAFVEPAAFVAANGAIAQQADVLVEPFLLPSLPQWARPVASASAFDAGWASYDDMLVVRSGDVDSLRDCLGRLVPVVQDAAITYLTDPAATNERIASLRAQFNPLTRAAPDLLDQGAAAGLAAGVFANGSDGAIGSFDISRLESFVPRLADALDLEPLAVTSMVTNDFVALDRSL